VITVSSTNGHMAPVGDREILWAGASGAFFCVMYGPFKFQGLAEDLKAAGENHEYEHGTVLTVYHEAEFGRVLFQVEQPARHFPELMGQEPKTLLERIKEFFKSVLKAD
jgi:hypothetical protein